MGGSRFKSQWGKKLPIKKKKKNLKTNMLGKFKLGMFSILLERTTLELN